MKENKIDYLSHPSWRETKLITLHTPFEGIPIWLPYTPLFKDNKVDYPTHPTWRNTNLITLHTPLQGKRSWLLCKPLFKETRLIILNTPFEDKTKLFTLSAHSFWRRQKCLLCSLYSTESCLILIYIFLCDQNSATSLMLKSSLHIVNIHFIYFKPMFP